MAEFPAWSVRRLVEPKCQTARSGRQSSREIKEGNIK